MAWTFEGVVSEGRVADIGDKAVYEVVGSFTDGIEVRTITTLFYSNPFVAPTNPQKAARRDAILANLNAVPEEKSSWWEQYENELRVLYCLARQAGNTPLQIKNAVLSCFDDLINN